MTRHERLYRRLLRLYPDDFRAHYGAEMTRLFADQLHDAEASREPMAVASLWVRSIVDLVATAPKHHLEKEHHVPQPVDGPSASLVAEDSRVPARVPRVLLGLLPLWVLLFLLVAAPRSMDPMFDSRASVAGLPAGVPILAVGLVLMAIGLEVLRRRTSTMKAVVAFVCFTVPSAVLVFMTPAIILILLNIGSAATIFDPPLDWPNA